jgi:hypothetical protein
MASIAELVDELADASWWHPAWLALAGGTALLEALARWKPDRLEDDVYSAYLAANGSPRSDTFMARDRRERDDSTAAAIGRAVLAASAAAGAVRELDGRLPGQPLAVALRRDGGGLRRAPLPDGRRAAFVTPAGRFLAELGDLDALARDLGAACAARPPGPRLRAFEPDALPQASVAADLAPQALPIARHLHRRAWTPSGGPWLGVGRTAALDLVTTCHLAVDGYGHALLARRVFDALDDRAQLERLVAAAREGLGGAGETLPDAGTLDGALPLGFAAEVVDAAAVRFPRLTYALGRTLDALSPSRSRFTPTFSVAVAQGERDDPQRRLRRVAFVALSLRRHDGELEGFEAFRERLRAAVAAESTRPGLLMRTLAATATAPLPRALRRRLLASEGRPSRWVPPVEVLAGRASLSLIRHPPDERAPAPLYAASSPGLLATRGDPLGSFVITIVDHGTRCTVSLDGIGLTGSDAGARQVLERYLAELRGR